MIIIRHDFFRLFLDFRLFSFLIPLQGLKASKEEATDGDRNSIVFKPIKKVNRRQLKTVDKVEGEEEER